MRPTCSDCGRRVAALIGWRGAARDRLRTRGPWSNGLRLEVWRCGCGAFTAHGWTPGWGSAVAHRMDSWRTEILTQYESRTG
jgi:hypothetical protein